MRASRIFAAIAWLTLSANGAAQGLLINGSLDEPGTPGDFAVGWTLVELPQFANAATFAPIANHTPGIPGNGLWLRPFEGASFGNHNELTSAQLVQVVPASPGLQYAFKGWSRWEGGYSGGVSTLHPMSPSGPATSPTKTLLQLQFLNGANNPLKTFDLDLRTQQVNDGEWRQHTLSGLAPAGTTTLRVAALALNMIPNVDLQPGGQSAFFDDFSLSINIPLVLGDFDRDGDVDIADYLNLSSHLHSDVSSMTPDRSYWLGDLTRDRKINGNDFRGFRIAFDVANGSGAFAAAVGAIPEPAGAVLAAFACAAFMSRRRP